MIPPPLMACRLLPLHSEIHAKAARGDLSTSTEGEIEMRVSRHPLYPASSIHFILLLASTRHLAAELAPRGASPAAKCQYWFG
jgi:hypothetical protein